MIVKCKTCGKEFNDKWYIFYKNKSGWHEMLIGHANYHEEKKLIDSHFKKMGKLKL